MTTVQPPDWALDFPYAPGIHNEPARSYHWQQMSADQQRALWEKLMQSIVQQVILAIEGFLLPGDALAQLTSWAEGIPILGDFVHALTGDPGDYTDLEAWAQKLLDVFSPLNAQNLYNQISSELLGLIPVGGITDWIDNLLTNPFYETLESVFGDGVWNWTSTPVTGGSGGAVTVTANGALHELLSDPPTRVVAGQVIDLSHLVQWSGAAGTGQVAKFSAVGYDGAGAVVTQHDVAAVTSPAASGNTALSGSWTIPSGVESVRLKLGVTANATAGTFKWGNASLTRPTASNPIKQPWVDNLPADIGNLFSGVTANTGNHQSLLDNLAAVGSGGTLAAIAARLAALSPGGLFDAASLTNITGIPALPQSKVSNLTTDLASIIDSAVTGAGALSGSGFTAANLQTVLADLQKMTTQALNGFSLINAQTLGQQNSGKYALSNFGLQSDASSPPAEFVKVVDTGAGSVGLVSGTLTWQGGLVSGTEVYLHQTPLLTDYFEVSATIPQSGAANPFGLPGSTTSKCWLVGRANSTGSQRCVCYADNTSVRVGYVDGATTTWFGPAVTVTSPFGGVDKMPAGAVVRFRGGTTAGARVFQVVVNTAVVATFTDVAAVSALDSSHRYCGWGMTCDAVYLPGTISGWTAADNAPTPTRGVGLRVYRSAAGTVHLGLGAQMLPAGTFNVADRVTSDMTWSGRSVTIGTEGWYEFTVGWMAGTAEVPTIVFRNSVAAAEDYGPVPLYCAVGDVMTPGTYGTADVAPTGAWFTAILLNRSTA